jgi:hypothetical protein
MITKNCICGSDEFLVITEKIYEGYIDEGMLVCEPDNEDVMEIKCRSCQKIYDAKSFKSLEY